VSRDGKQIIIIGCNELGQKGGEDGTLYIYNKESGKTRIFADKVDVFRPLFSPDGKEILFQRKKNLYVKSVAEERERRLTQFNGKLDISLVHWGEGSIYIITLKPTAEELAGAVDRWLKSKMKGKEPSYIKEVWRISFVRKEVRIKNIKSFRTMKQGIDIYGNTLLVSLPGGSGTSNIWKFDLEKGRLTQLTFGKDMDDLPMVIPGEGTIIFRRNLKNIYRMDKEGKTRPLKIFSYMP
jgi:Tol biopolymer transport system component